MSNIAIKVEDLGKKYVINHETCKGDDNFREVVIGNTKKMLSSLNPFSKSSSDIPDHTTEDFWALNDVNFTINKGDKVGIIGRNGAGKSTLLKVLSRITEPTTGKIHINGRIASLLEVGTGFHPELTGRENIFLNGAILGMSRKEIKEKFDEIVAFAEVDKFLDTPVKRYSSGMYVRLAFSVAAHLEPEILVVDEVLAVGDVEFQKKCLGKMKDVSDEGRTILFVSHNMNAIEQLCNKIILMKDGKLVEQSNDVRDTIQLYLTGDSLNDSNSKWINTKNQYVNQFFIPLSLTVEREDGHVITNNIANNEDAYVVITGDVQEKHSALCVGYALFDENNNLLYWSYNTDDTEEKWQSIKEGKNILRSKIPRRLLNEGIYRIELLISLHFISWICEPQKNSPSINFTIQGGLSDSPYWMIRRPGVLAPILTWEIVE